MSKYKIMVSFEKISVESPDDPTKLETKGVEEEKFDAEEIKTEYAGARLEHIKSEAEFNRLLEEQLKAADALIANPEDEAAKKNFWEISDDLDKIRDQREEMGKREGDLLSQLLMNESGGENLEAGNALFFEKFVSFIKENPELVKWVYPENIEFRSGVEKVASLNEKLERLKELGEEIEALKDRFASFKREAEELVQKFDNSFRTGADLEGLKININRKKEIAIEMKIVNIELAEKRIEVEMIIGSFYAEHGTELDK